MAHPLRIFSGAAVQLSIYDDTNGLAHLGYIDADGGEFNTLSMNAGISDGNMVPLKDQRSFSFPLIQTDTAGPMAELETRKGIAQSVYIIGSDVAAEISNCFLTVDLERSFKAGEVHKLMIKGSTYKDADVEVHVNLLGTDGNMNTDGGSGVATGWTNLLGTSLSIDTSHLAGEGNEQRITLSDSSNMIFHKQTFPLDQVPITFTVSAYIDNRKAGISYFRIGVITWNSSDVSQDINYEEKTLANGADGRQTYSSSFIPSSDIKSVGLIVQGSDLGTAELGIDNCQLELGELSDFTTG